MARVLQQVAGIAITAHDVQFDDTAQHWSSEHCT